MPHTINFLQWIVKGFHEMYNLLKTSALKYKNLILVLLKKKKRIQHPKKVHGETLY